MIIVNIVQGEDCVMVSGNRPPPHTPPLQTSAFVLCENACGSPDVCRLVTTVTLHSVCSYTYQTARCASTETCEGVRCNPGKVCKMKMGRPQCVCSPDCSHISRKHAVCGSDGKSYKDECTLLMARCMGHPDLEVMYQGECKSK